MALAAMLMMVLTSAGCGASTRSAPPVGSITVSAASSLTAALTVITDSFERDNPGVHVITNFAGSSTLVTQILNGAPTDVLATADLANMERLVGAGKVFTGPEVFARNSLTMVVAPGNPLHLRTLADLRRRDVVVGLGAPGVPVGDYARRILARARVEVTPGTLEPNVSAIITKVALGELDAGIVYVTDVAGAGGRVSAVAIPGDANVIASYPAAVVSGPGNRRLSELFLTYLKSPAAQRILGRFGFLAAT